MNAITLRSEKQLEGVKLTRSGKVSVGGEEEEQKDQNNHVLIDINVLSSHISSNNATNSIPFSDRFK